MDIKKYINSAIESLKAKAVVSSNTAKSRILAPISRTSEYISTASNSIKSSLGNKINTEKLQMQRELQQRQAEFAQAKINIENPIKQKLQQASNSVKGLNYYLGFDDQPVLYKGNNPTLQYLDKKLQTPRATSRLLFDVPSYGIGGILKAFREQPQTQMGDVNLGTGSELNQKYGKIALDGMVQGVKEKTPVFSELPRDFGMNPDSVPGMAVGLMGEIAIPMPGGEMKAGGKLLQGLEKEAVKFGTVEDFINKSPEAQKVFKKWFDNVWLKAQSPKVQEKWTKNFDSDMSMSAGVQVKEEIYQKVFSPLLKNVFDKANGIKTTLKTMGGDKNVMQGLFNESPAQTAMRRKAKISPNEVYHGAIDTIRTTEQKIQSTGKRVTDSFDQMMKDEAIPPQNKVNIFNYLSSPSKVLEKVGLGEQAKAISTAWDGYQMQLPKELEKISSWMARTPEKGAEVRIFDYLDGKARLNSLLPEEQKVAGEMKDYLKMWADKLGLPEDKRIGNYITHLFPKGAIEKEFDPEIARAIDSKVPSSVWNPFKQKRTNVEGYTRDVYQAIQAYTKRATRQSFVEGPLKALSEASEKLDSESYKYVQKVTANLNMRPAEVDNLIDTFIKSTPIGYKLTARPWAYITHALREATYKGALGLNISSATRNISQLNNSYALLGEKAFFKGGIEFVQRLAKKDLDELYTTGVLNDSFIVDKNLSVFKKGLEKVDDGIWSLFSFSEKVNRGISYFGAKSKALSEGKSYAEAIEIAKDFVSKTQFKFGPMDLPAVFMSDTAKLFGQFQSYNVKQGEFLVDLVKDKNWPALARYITGNLIFINLIGQTFGMTWQEMIPFSGVATGQTKLGQTPAISGITGIGKIASGYAFGNEEQVDSGKKDLTNSVASFIPAGVQLKKTFNGIKANIEGGVYTQSDNLRFPTENKAQNVLFGPNVSKTAREYYDNPQPLSENQTSVYQALIKAGATPQEAYAMQTANRGQGKKLENAIAGVEEKKPFNLVNFIMGKKETAEAPAEATGDSIFDYLNKASAETKQTAIIKEILSKISDPAQAEKALQQMGVNLTYEDASTEMIKSLDDTTQAEFLYKNMSKLTDAQFGEAIKKFVANDILTSNVVSKMVDAQYISEAKGKELKNYILMKKGKKFSTPKIKRFKINGKIASTKTRIKLARTKFAPLKKIKTPKLKI